MWGLGTGKAAVIAHGLQTFPLKGLPFCLWPSHDFTVDTITDPGRILRALDVSRRRNVKHSLPGGLATFTPQARGPGHAHSLGSATHVGGPGAPPARPVARGHTQKVLVLQGHPSLSFHPVCSLKHTHPVLLPGAQHVPPRAFPGASAALPWAGLPPWGPATSPATALQMPRPVPRPGRRGPTLPVHSESRPLQGPEAPLTQAPGARLLRPEAAGSLPPALGLGPRVLWNGSSCRMRALPPLVPFETRGKSENLKQTLFECERCLAFGVGPRDGKHSELVLNSAASSSSPEANFSRRSRQGRRRKRGEERYSQVGQPDPWR